MHLYFRGSDVGNKKVNWTRKCEDGIYTLDESADTMVQWKKHGTNRRLGLEFGLN